MSWTVESAEQPDQPKKPATPALGTIEKYESGGQNVPNYRYDQGHTAGGYLQITDTNWSKYAPGLGIDTSQYPNAMSAPKDVQYQVGAKMYAETGYAPWAPYNSRLAQAVGLKAKGWSVTDSGQWNVDDRAIRTAQSYGDGQVVWYDPHDYLGDLPPMDDEKEPAGARQRRELEESLDRGDKIEEIPHVDVQVKNGRATILDYDGRHRAQKAIEEGVNLIPVLVRGIPKGSEVKEFAPMRGDVRPWDFKAVAPVPEAQQPRSTQKGGDSYLSESWAAAGDALRAIPRAVEEMAQGVAGLAERSGAAEQGQPGEPPREAQIPLSGLERFGDLAVFATGGMPSRIGPEVGPAPIMPAGNALRQMSPETLASVDRARALGAKVDIAPEGENMMAAAQQAPPFRGRPPPLSQITPERAALARDAMQRDFQVTGPQNAATQVANERNLATKVSHTFGENAPALTPQVLGPAKRRIGQRMNEIEQGRRLPFDPPFRADMAKIEADAERVLTSKGRLNVVKQGIKDVMVDHVKTDAAKAASKAAPTVEGAAKAAPKEVLRGGLSGDQFADLVHEGGPIAQLADHPKDDVAMFGQKIEDALRRLMQRRLPPEEAAEYRDLRHQYKNLKTVEPAVGPTGRIDPVKLDNSVKRKFPNRRTDEQPTDLMRLSDIATEFLKPPPAAAHAGEWTKAAELVGGFTLGHIFGGPFGGVAGMVAARAGDVVARNALAQLTRPRLTETLIARALRELPPPGATRNALAAITSAARGAGQMTMPPAASVLRPAALGSPTSGQGNPRQ